MRPLPYSQHGDVGDITRRHAFHDHGPRVEGLVSLVGGKLTTFRPVGEEGTIEIPMTTVRLGGRNLPCSGGGYFRLLPYPVSRWQLRRVNQIDRQPCIFYFHPWEIDPEQPRQRGVSAKTAFRHYTGLRRMRGRLRRLLLDFPWTRMDRAFPMAAAERA